MRSLFALIALAPLALAAAGALAHDEKVGDLTIEHPWARASIGMAKAGASYMTIRNAGQAADRLVAVATDASERAELHTHIVEGDVMRMRSVEAIEIPAGQTVELKPGGLHVMLLGLKAPLREGEHFAGTLRFERAGEVSVEFAVEGAAAGGAAHQH